MTSPLVLRYFGVVGRAQPLRHALCDAGVAWEDVRLPFDATWIAHKADPHISGPYGGLPSLRCDGTTLGETLAIAAFLARRLGHEDGLDELAIARNHGIVSAAYMHGIVAVGELIWLELLSPGADVSETALRRVEWTSGKIDGVERQLPDDTWIGGERPIMADFFAAEAAEHLRALFGPTSRMLGARWPRLDGLAARMRQRPALQRAWAERPPQLTGHDDEAGMLTRLRAAIA